MKDELAIADNDLDEISRDDSDETGVAPNPHKGRTARGVGTPSPQDDVRGRRFRTRLSSHNLLTEAKEKELIQQYQGKNDIAARDQLVLLHQRLVIKIAFGLRWRCPDIPVDDLIQYGNTGLFHALDKFDPDKGVRFFGYAKRWITAYITIYIRDNSQHVRLLTTRDSRRAFSNLSKTRKRLREELGKEPNNEELAVAIGVDVEDVTRALLATRKMPSLDQPVRVSMDDSEGSRLGDLLHGSDEESVTGPIDVADLPEEICRILSTLPGREEAILRLRHGFDGKDPMTLLEVGKQMGISRERVRQLEVMAYGRLRRRGTALNQLKDFLD